VQSDLQDARVFYSFHKTGFHAESPFPALQDAELHPNQNWLVRIAFKANPKMYRFNKPV